MKKAFSLMEVIIALAIVGVVAAFLIPKMQGIAPNREKAEVLNTINAIESVTDELLNDPSIYREHIEQVNGQNILFSGLGDTSQHNLGADYDGSGKYVRLLYDRLFYKRAKEQLNMTISFNAANTTIEMKDNTRCDIGSRINQNDDNTNNQFSGEQTLRTTIGIVFPRHAGQNQDCSYNLQSCPQPNMYKFTIDNNGHIIANGGDYLSQAFLMNKTDLKNVDKDFQVAKDLYERAHPSN